MQKVLQSPIFRSIRPQYYENALENNGIAIEVISLINSAHPIVPALGEIAQSLNREVVISVLEYQAQLKKCPRICFRFFIWAADRARFRSGFSRNLIVDMLLSLRDRNSFDLYWDVLDEFRYENLLVPADAFAVLILGYWRLGNAEKAMESVDKMKDYGCKPNLAVYNVILNVLVKKGATRYALEIYNKIKKLNFSFGCDTYNVLIDGLFKSGKFKEAHSLYSEMIQRGIKPNKITHTVIISGLCREKRFYDALALFNFIKSEGLMLHSVTCTALLNGFCKFGPIDEAKKLFDSFRDQGHAVGIRMFSSMIDGLIRSKRHSEADELFKEVFNVGLEPDIILYTIMMRGLCEAGRMEDATIMFRDMIKKGVEPDAQFYNVFIKGFIDVVLPIRTRSLKLEEERRREATNMLWDSIGNVLIPGFFDIIRARFFKRGVTQHDEFPNTYTYTILIHGLCRNNLLEDAHQIFSDMEKQGCSPSAMTYNILIHGLCKNNNLEEARLMFCKMENLKQVFCLKNPSKVWLFLQGADIEVESVNFLTAYKIMTRVAPDITTCNTLINGKCKIGDVDGVHHYAANLLKLCKLSPDSVTYATLINWLYMVFRDEDAHKMFEEMSNKGYGISPSVYKTLMTWNCRRGKNLSAFNIWLEYLTSLGRRDEKILKSAKEYIQKVDLEKALRSLLEMDIKLSDFDPSPYNIWLVGLCQIEKADEALKTFSILEKFNVVVSDASCVNLIRALCAQGNLTKAADIFRYTMEKGYRLMPSVCNGLLKALLESDDTAKLAFELHEKMISMRYDLNSDLEYRTKLLLNCSRSLKKMENVSAG